jgi:sigma-54 dependent transcriptional regulator, acetoin dehydrogenase operon transcriptional activator AcoR
VAGREAWEAFQSGAEPAEVSAQVLTSWRRSRWSGVDPADTQVPVRDIETDSDFVRIASPVLLRAADTLTSSPVSIALADAHGNIVWGWVSDRRIGQALEDVRVLAGASMREEVIGTNGVGTALESKQVAQVVGADHYVEAFHGWACAGATVIHPVTGRVVGAIGVSCFESDASQFQRAMTQSLADGVSGRLVESATARERAMLDAFLVGQQRTTAPIVVVNERMMIVDEVAGAWGLQHDTVWELVRDASARIDLVLKAGLRGRAHPLDDGVGVLITLHPDPRAPADASPPVPAVTPLESAEAAVIAAMLSECNGNKSAAAGRLGISRATLYSKLRRYRIGTPGQISLPR